jgi:hypothetical protein
MAIAMPEIGDQIVRLSRQGIQDLEPSRNAGGKELDRGTTSLKQLGKLLGSPFVERMAITEDQDAEPGRSSNLPGSGGADQRLNAPTASFVPWSAPTATW